MLNRVIKVKRIGVNNAVKGVIIQLDDDIATVAWSTGIISLVNVGEIQCINYEIVSSYLLDVHVCATDDIPVNVR